MFPLIAQSFRVAAAMSDIHIGAFALTAERWPGNFYPMPIFRWRFGSAQSRNQDDWWGLFNNAARR